MLTGWTRGLGVCVALSMLACAKPSTTTEADILPAVKAYLDTHAEYGTVTATRALPDWANGQRQRVETTSGEYLFYVQEAVVVTVRDANDPTRILWSR